MLGIDIGIAYMLARGIACAGMAEYDSVRSVCCFGVSDDRSPRIVGLGRFGWKIQVNAGGYLVFVYLVDAKVFREAIAQCEGAVMCFGFGLFKGKREGNNVVDSD